MCKFITIIKYNYLINLLINYIKKKKKKICIYLSNKTNSNEINFEYRYTYYVPVYDFHL